MQPQNIYELIGTDAYDAEGAKVGRVGQVFLDDRTDEPTWATVSTGLFGTRESFVPLDGSRFEGGRLNLAYPKSRISEAPSVGSDGHLTPEEEERLYDFYEVADPAPAERADTSPTSTATATPTSAASSGSTGTADDAMTRSEERLHVDTTAQVSGRARMRKYVVTEEVQVTVPVRREKVVLETDPGEPGPAADQRPLSTTPNASAEPAPGTGAPSTGPTTGHDLSARDSLARADGTDNTDEAEMILYEERPVVTTETVPAQRVRLGTTEEIVEETVTEDVRTERVQLDDDTQTPPSR